MDEANIHRMIGVLQESHDIDPSAGTIGKWTRAILRKIDAGDIVDEIDAFRFLTYCFRNEARDQKLGYDGRVRRSPRSISRQARERMLQDYPAQVDELPNRGERFLDKSNPRTTMYDGVSDVVDVFNVFEQCAIVLAQARGKFETRLASLLRQGWELDSIASQLKKPVATLRRTMRKWANASHLPYLTLGNTERARRYGGDIVPLAEAVTVHTNYHHSLFAVAGDDPLKQRVARLHWQQRHKELDNEELRILLRGMLRQLEDE